MIRIREVPPNEARKGDYIDTFLWSEFNQLTQAESRLLKILKRNGVKRELVRTRVTQTKTWQLFLLP